MGEMILAKLVHKPSDRRPFWLFNDEWNPANECSLQWLGKFESVNDAFDWVLSRGGYVSHFSSDVWAYFWVCFVPRYDNRPIPAGSFLSQVVNLASSTVL